MRATGPFLGFGILFACFWGWAGLVAVMRRPDSRGTLERPIAFLVIMGMVCLAGLIFSFHRIARYNRRSILVSIGNGSTPLTVESLKLSVRSFT